MIFQTSMIMFHVNLQGCKYFFRGSHVVFWASWCSTPDFLQHTCAVEALIRYKLWTEFLFPSRCVKSHGSVIHFTCWIIGCLQISWDIGYRHISIIPPPCRQFCLLEWVPLMVRGDLFVLGNVYQSWELTNISLPYQHFNIDDVPNFPKIFGGIYVICVYMCEDSQALQLKPGWNITKVLIDIGIYPRMCEYDNHFSGFCWISRQIMAHLRQWHWIWWR